MVCKLKTSTFFVILALWLGCIILFTLFLNTSGLKEGLFQQGQASYDDTYAQNMKNIPSATNMSILNENRVSTDCCPSTYSTSNGCVCLANEQLQLMHSRGGNRTAT